MILPNEIETQQVQIKDIQKLNQAFSIDLDNRFWACEEDFLREGFGFAVKSKNSGDFLSLCYSAAVSNNIAEIDIVTGNNFKNKGYAQLVANLFINHCHKLNILPNWDCYTNNLPSYKLAKKLGFIDSFKYDLFTINLKGLS